MSPLRDAPEEGGEIFIVSLQGWVIQCSSVDDAVAIKKADGILSNGDGHQQSPVELCRLAFILKKFDCLDAAKSLEHRAVRQRAKAVLKKAGYESPLK